jgi:vacuolar-type H+-ATPase subunit E/Vma4
MPLDDLVAAIEKNAEAQAAAELEEARAESARVTAAAEAEAAVRRTEYLAQKERECWAEVQVVLVAARREASRAVLTAQARLLDQIFAAAAGRLSAAMKTKAFRIALPAHVREALAYIDGLSVVIRCPSAIADAVLAATAGGDNVRVEVDDGSPPGVVVSSTDGSVSIDNTLPARITRLRPDLAVEIMKGIE